MAVRTGEGIDGVSLLLIERTMSSVKTRQMQCSDAWASGTAYIIFEDVKVPMANLIREENKGFKYIMHNSNHEHLSVCMQAHRCACVYLKESIKYASKHETFGRKLIGHQVIRHKVANMA